MLAGIRKVGVAVLVGVASLGSAGVAAVATATPSGAATCTNSWQGPTTGTTDWNASAANWSAGFPTASGVTCISLAGTYTVVLKADVNLGALQVGGGASGVQTLKVDGSVTNVSVTLATPSLVGNGGELLLAPSTGFGLVSGAGGLTVNSGGTLATAGPSNTAYLRTNITNQAGGTMSIGAANSLQDVGTATTNNGTLTVSAAGHLAVGGVGAFTNSGAIALTGSITIGNATYTQNSGSISGNPVIMSGGGTLADAGGTGSIDVTGSINVSGVIPSGQTVTVDGSITNVTLNATSALTDSGTLVLNPSTGFAWLGGSDLTVTSGGVFATGGSGNISYLRSNITNQSGGTVNISGSNTRQDQSTTTTNNGTFTVALGGAYLASGGGSSFGFVNAGSLTITGSLTIVSDSFTQTSGSISGNAVVLSGGSILVDTSGTGAFDITGSSTLIGNIPTGQTVTVDGSVTNVTLTLSGATTVHGVLNLNPSVGFTWLNGPGSVTIASGGVFATGGSGNISYLRSNITNQSGGTVNISGSNTRQDQSTTTTNNGTFTVAVGGAYLASGGGSSFGFVNAGSLTITGSLTIGSDSFTQTSGSISGNAVVLAGSSTLVDTSGTGAFNITGSSTLTGNIPTGQTVTVDGSVTNVILNLSGATTVNGTLTMSPTNGFTWLNGPGALTVASGGVFTTTGSGSTAYLRTNITNQAGGTITISAPNSNQDQGTNTTNNGTLRVTDGGHLALTSGSTLSTSAGATLGVSVNGTTNVASGISGPGVTLAGTLSVTTVGSPTLGHMYVPISGPVVGAFTMFSFGGAGYSVTYPGSSVLLTVVGVFTTTPTPLAPKENIALVTPQVASIANATAGTGTYSATVNYGDGGGPVAATVAILGTTGMVTGPSHTYTAPGTYTVQTSVANTNGTTQVTSESVVVTGPAVTGFSLNKVVHGQKLVTLIAGTGFDASAVATVSNPGVTVTLTKFITGIKLKLKLTVSNSAVHGWFTVTITQTNGTAIVVHAIKVK